MVSDFNFSFDLTPKSFTFPDKTLLYRKFYIIVFLTVFVSVVVRSPFNEKVEVPDLE